MSSAQSVRLPTKSTVSSSCSIRNACRGAPQTKGAGTCTGTRENKLMSSTLVANPVVGRPLQHDCARGRPNTQSYALRYIRYYERGNSTPLS